MSKSKNAQIRYAVFFVMLVTVFSFLLGNVFAASPAHADMGPKPSVTVDFANLPDVQCYGTLLSKHESTGPSAVWDGKEETKYCFGLYTDEADKAAWQAFVDHADPDGYHFLQTFWDLRKNAELSWGYYPPSSFKIALYFPDSGTFVSSDIYESYAFHSYFSVDMSGVNIDATSSTPQISAKRSYDHTWEIVSLIARIIATVLIELGLAWLFKLRKKYQILTILIANIITQALLNVSLYLLNYFDGSFIPMLIYIPSELAVFVIESIAYTAIFVPRENNDAPLYANASPVSSGYCALYAFCANAISFALGIALSFLLPGMF